MSADAISRPLTLAPERKSAPMTKLLLVLLIVAGAVIPLLVKNSPFLMLLASHALIAGIVALSLDVLTGNVGLLSFGHATWYGFGAYGAGLAAKHLSPELFVVLPLTAAAAAVTALLIGLILVRQVGKTFAILTLALSQIAFAAVFVFSMVTGGEDGLQGIPSPTLLGIAINRPDVWYWLLYAALVASLALALHVRRSPMGKTCIAIRENTERARFIGIDVGRVKLLAYISSAALAAMAGGLHALFTGAASPDLLHWTESGKILMYAVLGGVGTLVGPVIGAGAFTVAEHYVSSWTDSWQIYFGGLFVLVVIVAPGGLFGVGRVWWQKLARRGAQGAR
jgi:branched-chain amino acid transport system permease protein